jgi:elongation factor G
MERKTELLRNIAFVAHAASGKTSLAEAVLFNGKATARLGKVDEGTSNLNYEPEEIKRGITISTAVHHCTWKKQIINLLDTPGDYNFISEARLALQAADAAVVVIDATAGVKVGTEKVWEFTDQEGLPRIVFINKLDRERSDFYKMVEDVATTLQTKATPIAIPIGAEESFEGVVDLVKMKACMYSKDGSGKFQTTAIPAELEETAAEWREKMIENIVEADDDLMEKYLEGEPLTDEEIETTLVQGVKSGALVPVTCGSATQNIGVPNLMDLIIQTLPSPAERPPKKGLTPGSDEEKDVPPDENAPFSGLVFKTIADPFAGKLTLLRIFSGKLEPDSTVYDSNKDAKEKFGQLFLVEGKKQQPIEAAMAGDIVAIPKLKEVATGDTLCALNSPIVYKSAELMPPVISYAVEAKVQGTEDKVFGSLSKLLDEDPTLKLGRDQTTSEIILSGTGQIHLEATCEKLSRKYGVEVTLNPVQVPYRETIKKEVKGVIYRHKKQTGGRGQFAEVHFDVAPLERGSGFEFEEALVGMNVPRNFVPAVEKGIVEALPQGFLAGYPLVDLKVRFYDGKSHDVDSSEMAFKIAASMCLKKAIQEATPTLLEPVMKMEITVPEEVMGDVMGDLNGRRGRVLGMDSIGKYQVIKANVPMAEVLKYALDLNSMSAGRGFFTMEHSHYEEVPAQLAEKIIAAAKEQE